MWYENHIYTLSVDCWRRRAPIGLAGYSIAQEHHADGGLYLHALIKLDKKPNIKDSTVYFGLAEGEEVVHHPNIDTNVRNFNVVKEYVRKKHRENIKQAEEAGLLIEHWPDAMDNAGRNKRKVCGFEADEIEEAVKRSRTSEQALRELENLNRGLLAANFNNYKNYIRWTLPQYDFQEYVPDFERRNWILPPHHLMQALVALVINRWCCMAVPGFLNAWKQILGKKNGWIMLGAFQEYLTVDRRVPCIMCCNKDPRTMEFCGSEPGGCVEV
ncbi:unnamed protein product [Rhizophagus irregularis]|nr:unnamed protein product [Rhizophagus irregularis]